MGQNWGSLQGGPSFYDVSLDVAQDQIGDSLSVYLSDLDAGAEWQIIVYANVHEGQFRVGQMVTRSPANGDPFARLVACAHAPGARGWKVSARSVDPAANYQAGVTLASSPASSLAAVGVVSVHHGDISSGARTHVSGGPLSVGAPSQLSANLGTVYSVQGNLDQADVVNAHAWVMLFDSLAAPTGASVPFFVQHVGQAAGAANDPTSFAYDGGPFGRLVQYGLWIATSSTPDAWTVSPYSVQANATFARA